MKEYRCEDTNRPSHAQRHSGTQAEALPKAACSARYRRYIRPIHSYAARIVVTGCDLAIAPKDRVELLEHLREGRGFKQLVAELGTG